MIGPQQAQKCCFFSCPEAAINPVPEKLVQEREVDAADRGDAEPCSVLGAPGCSSCCTEFGQCVRRRKCAFVAYTSWGTKGSQASFQPKKAPQAGPHRNSHHTGWFKVKTDFQEQKIFATVTSFLPLIFFLTQKGNICWLVFFFFFFSNCLEP